MNVDHEKNTGQHHLDIKGYQDLNALPIMVNIYMLASIYESLKRVVSTKNKDNENLIEYLKLLKQAKEILEAHIVKYILRNYVENLKDFKNTTGEEDKKKIKSEEFNKWMAYLLIVNLEKLEYSSLENGFESQYSM